MKVCDLTDPANPKAVPTGVVKLAQAGRHYLARTYAYVPNGKDGLAIINIENPEQPKLDQMFNAGGALDDCRAVQIGSVNASMFALQKANSYQSADDAAISPVQPPPPAWLGAARRGAASGRG